MFCPVFTGGVRAGFQPQPATGNAECRCLSVHFFARSVQQSWHQHSRIMGTSAWVGSSNDALQAGHVTQLIQGPRTWVAQALCSSNSTAWCPLANGACLRGGLALLWRLRAHCTCVAKLAGLAVLHGPAFREGANGAQAARGRARGAAVTGFAAALGA
jgi:hypothetical protein